MFYQPENGHGLPHNPFNAIVTPRPIAWVSSRGEDGQDNLAPYSFFNAIAYTPPQVMFASTGSKPDRGDTKDSVANIRQTGVFCVNIVGFALKDAMNATSGPWACDVDEFSYAGIEKGECETIDCPRVLASPASLECRVTQIIDLKGQSNFMVIGEVTGVHIRDEYLKDGLLDITTYTPLTRLGYQDYSQINDCFTMTRPEA